MVDVGVVPTAQNLHKNGVPERTLIVNVRHYALVRCQEPIAFYASAIGVEGRFFVVYMQTTQTMRTGLLRRHVPAMTHNHVFATLKKCKT